MGSITEPTTFGKYVLNGVTTKEEMDKIMDVIWEANYDPYDPFVQLFFPILGFTAADREAAVAESKERFWKEKQKSPDKHWFYIEDTDVQKIVACMQWEIAQQNPFPDGPPKLKAPWWPEGEHREFCELILNQTYAARANWMGRRHIALNWVDVIPSYRRLGLGSLLMASLIKYADMHKYECWLEASSMGKPLYEKFGYRSLMKVAFDTERKKKPSNVWRRCEHELTPLPIFAMWRPIGGKWIEGGGDGGGGGERTKVPWELGSTPVDS
ncbi:hypothetical protein K504DRAFT_442435 [Pleomassaria siparia CBS 279.74]|uniref:N-acetyltransferase domain-containing protein n=1 Tax=Pleomassaria siparia CBS 279.74 TaxID=1314801 RepID=A0A6G1JUX2_9PLEO|nr:hypothetical protein K504DRAFT_442435 [Pleomassaria siparia CBS 279.74]